MIWQDFLFTTGSVYFAASLIPTCLDERTTMPRYKSLPTALFLLAFAYGQFTLGMVVAPVTEVVCALCWGFIALRRAPQPAYRPRGWPADSLSRQIHTKPLRHNRWNR